MKPTHEHFAVIGSAALAWLCSYTNIERALKLVILAGTAVYVWRRALKKKLPKEEEIDVL